MTAAVEVTPGQSWAIRDDRYEGWRYVTVESVDSSYAHVKPRSRRGRRSRIQLVEFRRSRFTLCGYDGPGVLPALHGPVFGGCFNCGPRPSLLPLDRELLVGFGQVTVARDGLPVWRGGMHEKRRPSGQKRVAHAELWARDTPGDWRILFSGPLSEPLYQRQDVGWVLVWHGFGFA